MTARTALKAAKHRLNVIMRFYPVPNKKLYLKGDFAVKKNILFLLVFIAVFMTVYIVLCYSPWFALKLSAPPLEYFIASVKKLWYIKGIISGISGFAAGCFVVYRHQ